MAFSLPPAGSRYSRSNENQSRRTIEQAFADLIARLELAESQIADGITPPEPVGPTAAFTFEADFLSVAFTDASTAGDAAITERLWTFGDGTTSTTVNNSTPFHTYPDAGVYTATLMVTDAAGLTDTSDAVEVTVVESGGLGAPAFLVRGVRTVSDLSPYPWWNAGQIGGMNPSNIVERVDGFANAGKRCAVRLYQDAACKDSSGVFQVPLWKDSIRRYADAGLADYINARAEDGTIISFDLIDDILSGGRWGREILRAEVEEMAAYSRSIYFALPAWVRARFTQLDGFTYNQLQGCTSIYLHNRGGVSQGTMTDQEYRIADVTAYRDAELAAKTTLGVDVVSAFGLNVINGGDGTSGIPGDGSPANKFKMSAQEIRDYADVLVPVCEGSFQIWEWADDGSSDSYFARADIQASLEYVRDLCAAQ